MIDREIYMLKKEYLKYGNISNCIISLILDIIFFVVFPIIIHFLGYKEYINDNWKVIIILSIIIEILLLIFVLINYYNKKNIVIFKEGNRILFVKGYTKEMEITNGYIQINNVTIRSTNDIFSVVIGLLINRKENSKLYNKTKKIYIDMNKRYKFDDILDDLSISFKYYDNCELISKNKKYFLYKGEKIKNNGDSKKVKFKIYNYYESKLNIGDKNV